MKPALLIGAHANGGLKSSWKKALEIGASTFQIFIGSPQTWAAPSPGKDDFASFRKQVEKNKLGPVFVHGNYLVNLASPDDEKFQKSFLNMHTGLRLADRAGASGLIFHPGSTKSQPYDEAILRVVKCVEAILKDYDGDCKLLLEVCAGSGNTIGSRFSQFKDIFDALEFDDRLGVCWDTCHLYSAGYDIVSKQGLKETMDEFDELVGFDRLVAIHANDSKTPFNSHKDRHENIGQGTIGEKAFARMLNQKQLRHLPWILEVPGYENKGPDRKNIETLVRLAG